MEKKTVLITGASSGIGEGCARKFAMNGYRLILNGRNVEKLTAVKRELETEYRADVCLLPFDVRDRGAAKAALDSLPEEWKAIDILINNAGLTNNHCSQFVCILLRDLHYKTFYQFTKPL